MKKVVLIWPPHKFGAPKAYGMPPLGLLYIAANVRKHGHHAEILDFSLDGYSLKDCISEILATGADVVGISVMTDRLYASLQIAQEIKEKAPNLSVVFGGAHINATGPDVMANLELGAYVDACFMKESEDTFVEYLNDGSPAGLIYRDDAGQVQQNPAVIPTFNLDDLPFPDMRDVSNVPAYYTPFFRHGPMVTMMATRGCPYTCSFCDVPTNMGKKYRHRSPENLVKEIQFHQKVSGVNNFSFKDSIFNLRRNDTMEFCELLLQKNIKINWACNSRVDTLREEVVQMMAKAGCRVINFGVESMNTDVLKLMNKKNTMDDIAKCITMCRSAGIASTAYYMVGNEGETQESYYQGLNQLIALNPTLASFSITTAYPGTEQYHHAVLNGALKNPEWYNDFAPTDNTGGYSDLPGFSVKEQQEAAKSSTAKFFFRPLKILEIYKHFFSIQFIKMGLRFVLRKNNQFEY